MIEIVNGEKTIKIPEEMTIGMYIQFDKNKDEYINNPTKLITLFTGLSERELKNSPRKTIDLVHNYLLTKIKEPDFSDLVKTFVHDGVEYGLEEDFGKMAWGAWVDLEVYSVENITDNIHKIMAVLYRPIKTHKGKRYTIEPYDSESIDSRAHIFLDIPVSYWFKVSDFFLAVANLSITNIKGSLVLTNKLQKATLMGMKILPKWLQRRLLRGSTLS